ncbi:MAG: molybdopterin-guanine dinucleotide biosynthesis protein MobB [Defluviitaleaceae bacterium]|nr:molybdopterin-guanine dinucleotide biosynthesis protein MobB [Defluviitaleaceae bacterium]
MKIFSICGISGSGKTTTIEAIISELVRRGYKVGSVKDIHNQQFAIDPRQDSNTNRHKQAGATLVTARGLGETSILYPNRLPVDKILDAYEREGYDWVVLEGVDCIKIPTIVTAHSMDDLAQKWSDMAFAASGRISSEIDGYEGKPAIDATTNVQQLVDLVELGVYSRLPNFPDECCMVCGYSCNGLAAAIIAGEKRRSDCVADKGVELLINGRPIKMVPFVQEILKNALVGVVSTLEGYEKGCDIEVRLSDNLLQQQTQ